MNFKKFFQDYGCCGGDRDDLSVSSSDSNESKKHKTKKFEKLVFEPKPPERKSRQFNESKSEVSSTHWTELENTRLSARPTITTYLNTSALGESSFEREDYTTQEPIDFESLKRSIEQEKEDTNNNEVANSSMLSKKSKKIHKESQQTPRSILPIDPKSKRKPWQAYEDAQVVELVDKYGARWAKIASFLPGRTGKQVRDRYTNKLRPSINKDEWTKEEEKIFHLLYKQMGNKWSKIASQLPGRTEGQVKNRFYAQFRKKVPSKEETSSPRGTSLSNQTGDAIEIEARLIDADDPTHVISYNCNSPDHNNNKSCYNQLFRTPETVNSSGAQTSSVKKSVEKLNEPKIERRPSQESEIIHNDVCCTCNNNNKSSDNNHCLNNLEILNQYQSLSKRINSIESLLVNILQDMKSFKNPQ